MTVSQLNRIREIGSQKDIMESAREAAERLNLLHDRLASAGRIELMGNAELVGLKNKINELITAFNSITEDF